MLPTFIVIGAMKCGTTSLYQYLDLHPEISMSSVKETDFFLERNKHDVTWYRSLFDGEAKAYGEASPNYTKYPLMSGVPKRMHALLPDAKLIYLVRDPIERILSHFIHNEAYGREVRPFGEVFSNDASQNHYVKCSRYFMQLERYRKYYDDDQILVIQSERLKTGRRSVLRKVFNFIGVDTSFQSEEYAVEAHKSSQKRVAAPMIRRIHRAVTRHRVVQEMMDALPESIDGWLRKGYRQAFKKPAERPKVTAPIENRIIEHLQDDVDRLRAYTGMTFSEWRL